MNPSAIAVESGMFDTMEMAPQFLRRIAASLLSERMEFKEFIRKAWPIIEPSAELTENWHIDLIAEYLMAVDAGQINRLLINIPPRNLKSNLVSVLWPTWSWIERSWLKWIFSSYALSLSVKHSLDRRRVMDSHWYQRNWGDVVNFQDDQNQKAKYENTQRGVMLSTSVGGSVTGEGGNRIVIDDQLNPQDAESELNRVTGIEHYQRTLSTRLNDKQKDAIVCIEQRLHTRDLSSVLLKEDGWTHVKIPAIAPTRIVVKFPISGREVVRQEGAVICEAREPKAILDKQKAVMGSRAFAAQYQQDPVSEEGGLFQHKWWKFWREPRVYTKKIWFWDTAAKEKEMNDFSCGTYWGVHTNGYDLIRMVKERMAYPTLKRRVASEFATYPAEELVIEDKSSGEELLADFREDGKLPIIAFLSDKDKVLRASLVSPIVEAGRVALPDPEYHTEASWVNDYMDNLANFPNVDHDDDVDSTTGALMRMSGKDQGGNAMVTVG